MCLWHAKCILHCAFVMLSSCIKRAKDDVSEHPKLHVSPDCPASGHFDFTHRMHSLSLSSASTLTHQRLHTKPCPRLFARYYDTPFSEMQLRPNYDLVAQWHSNMKSSSFSRYYGIFVKLANSSDVTGEQCRRNVCVFLLMHTG